MKTLNDYLAMSYRMEIVEDKDEGGFVVSYPELPGCITCGETIERAVENAADAKKAWLEAALEEGIENACVLSNASLHLDLLVSRELLKLRHFRIGAPLHFIKRTTALCLYRSTSRSLEAEEKCRTIALRKAKDILIPLIAVLYCHLHSSQLDCLALIPDALG